MVHAGRAGTDRVVHDSTVKEASSSLNVILCASEELGALVPQRSTMGAGVVAG